MRNAEVTSRAADQAWVVWEIAGKPVTICITQQVMHRMMLEALGGLGRLSRGRGTEVGGILLGVSLREGGRRLVRIEDFKPVDCEHAFGPSYVLSEADKQDLKQVLEQYKRTPEARLYVVGYWRSHTRGAMALAAEDLALLASYFAQPHQVALLIEPRATGPGKAAVFLWERGRVGGDVPCGIFDFSEGLPKARPAADEGGGTTAPRQTAVTARLTGQVQAPEPVQGGKARGLRRFVMLGGLLVVLAWAALYFWGYAPGQDYARRFFGNAAHGRDPFAIDLRGEERDGSLYLSWDQHAPAVLLAERGVLSIADGDQLRVLELGREELRGGSVVYQRSSDRVSVRLELLWGRRSLAESWQFEGGK